MAQHTTATASAIKNDQKQRKILLKADCREERLFPLPLLGTSSAASRKNARSRGRQPPYLPYSARDLAPTPQSGKRHSERTVSIWRNERPVVGLVNSQTGHPSRCRPSCMGNRPRASVSRTDNPTTHENTARPDRIVRSLYENLAIRAAKPGDQKQLTLSGVVLSSSIQICVVIAVPECRRGGAPPRHRRPGAPSPSRRSGSPSPPRTRPSDRGRSCARFHGGM